jgi:hypothetical protein
MVAAGRHMVDPWDQMPLWPPGRRWAALKRTCLLPPRCLPMDSGSRSSGQAWEAAQHFAWPRGAVARFEKMTNAWCRSGKVSDPSWAQTLQFRSPVGRSPCQPRYRGRRELHSLSKEPWCGSPSHWSSCSFYWQNHSGASPGYGRPKIPFCVFRVEVSGNMEEKSSAQALGHFRLDQESPGRDVARHKLHSRRCQTYVFFTSLQALQTRDWRSIIIDSNSSFLPRNPSAFQ